MNFTYRKLPTEAAESLRICKVDSVSAFALMLAPVYVYMKLNKKFVAVKGPLDFFTSAEIEKYRSMESFFVPKFVDQVEPFSKAGRRVKAILKLAEAEQDREDTLPAAPYEISDSVIQTIGSLWAGRYGELEVFFAVVLANELCELLPEVTLLAARERNIETFEEAVLISGWTVFVALHLGVCELTFLNLLRLRVFEAIALEQPLSREITGDMRELVVFAEDTIRTRRAEGNVWPKLSLSEFELELHRSGGRFRGRLKRVSQSLQNKKLEPPSLFGPRGVLTGKDSWDGVEPPREWITRVGLKGGET